MQADRPTATELIEIIAETLSESVVPATAPHAQHQARVAANLCRILARELAAHDCTAPHSSNLAPDLAAAVADSSGSLGDLNDDQANDAYHDVLELVRAKLDVVKPGYDTHDAEAEARVIA